MKSPFHVEVVQKKESTACKEFIKELVHSYLCNLVELTPGVSISHIDLNENSNLKEHVEGITLCDVGQNSVVCPTSVDFIYHVFKLDSFGAETDTMTDASTSEEFAVAQVWALPSRDFHGLWESLIYDSKIKDETVRFVETALELADHGVDPHVIGCNRVVLLHGPPGTGKTSLCRALAQKLAVRLGERYSRSRLLEINAHGLFSKWFAESGKLVARLFERVSEVVADRRLFACVLVDEVESLATARRAALAGLEPSDAVRAVNALLTQLDQLRRHPNVLVLTTSNVTAAIDVAFVDRADLKRFVGLPGPRATYEILRGCCTELRMRGLVRSGEQVFMLHLLEATLFAESENSSTSLRLWHTAREASNAGLSGRALRRLPLLALALHMSNERPLPLEQFLEALQRALQAHLADTQLLSDG